MKRTVVNNGIYDIPVNEYEASGRGFVIGCHGLRSSKDIGLFTEIGERLSAEGIAFLAFDFPGHGDSPVTGERLNNAGSLQDLLMVFKYAHQKYGGNAGLLGTSYGSEIVWEFAYEVRRLKVVKKIACFNAAMRRDEVIRKFLGDSVHEIDEKGFTMIGRKDPLMITKEYLEGLRHLEIYGAPRDNSLERIFLHGEADDIASFEDVRRFTEENGFRLYSFPGEGHVFSPAAERKSAEIVADFMKDL